MTKLASQIVKCFTNVCSSISTSHPQTVSMLERINKIKKLQKEQKLLFFMPEFFLAIICLHCQQNSTIILTWKMVNFYQYYMKINDMRLKKYIIYIVQTSEFLVLSIRQVTAFVYFQKLQLAHYLFKISENSCFVFTLT